MVIHVDDRPHRYSHFLSELPFRSRPAVRARLRVNDPRLRHCRYLDGGHSPRLSSDVLPEPYVSYLGSGEGMARLAAGWAEAVRHMQRQLVAPVPGARGKVEALLVHEVRCLVTGDLGALAWREPPLCLPAAQRSAGGRSRRQGPSWSPPCRSSPCWPPSP